MISRLSTVMGTPASPPLLFTPLNKMSVHASSKCVFGVIFWSLSKYVGTFIQKLMPRPYETWSFFTLHFCVSHNALIQNPARFPNTSAQTASQHTRSSLCLSDVCAPLNVVCLHLVSAAHPNSSEAALGAGGGAGGVSLGSQTVHGVRLCPDWMFAVSLYSLCSFASGIYCFYFYPFYFSHFCKGLIKTGRQTGLVKLL